MKITIIGAGYVGLVSAACFAHLGVDVICVDNNPERIKNLQSFIMPIYEKGLKELVVQGINSGKLTFTDDLKTAVHESDIIFIAVGTPSRRGDGHADLSYVYQAAKQIAENITGGYKIIVTKSTVPVGTGKKIMDIVKHINPDAECDVVSNPEFLREGMAIDDFLFPERVVIGALSARATHKMQELYQPLMEKNVPMVNVGLETAELIKYSANAFLALKITFINEIADLSERVGANVEHIAYGMGLDSRIGAKFLSAGPGYGGSCFPKDTRALMHTSQDYHVPMKLIESVVAVNDARAFTMSDKIMRACGGSVKNKKIAVLGLTFKPDTDDMRESPSLRILPILLQNGANIHAYDPQGKKEASEYFKDSLSFCDNAYHATENADAVILMTHWQEFLTLDFEKLKHNMQTPIMIDLRNLYNPDIMRAGGFIYHSIGR